MIGLVTGASGFIGRSLVTRLLAEGWEVFGVSRSEIPSSLAHHPRLIWIVGDISENNRVFEEIKQVDMIFHLAGATLGAGKDESVFLSANEATTVHLLKECCANVKKLIYASSQVVYGDVNSLSVSEDFPLLGLDSAYSCSKVNAENWLRWFYNKGAFSSIIVLRFCGFISGGGLVDYIMGKALNNQPIELFGSGDIYRDYLPIDKGIDALLAASKYPVKTGFHVFNIGSGQKLTSMQLAQIICTELSSHSALVPIKNNPLRSNFVFDITKARTELGFNPGSLVEAVREYARKRATNNISNNA